MVGTAGTVNCAKFVKSREIAELQLALPAISVYGVPRFIPVITPAAPTLGPIGSKV